MEEQTEVNRVQVIVGDDGALSAPCPFGKGNPAKVGSAWCQYTCPRFVRAAWSSKGHRVECSKGVVAFSYVEGGTESFFEKTGQSDCVSCKVKACFHKKGFADFCIGNGFTGTCVVSVHGGTGSREEQ